jgi:hypothetical protein
MQMPKLAEKALYASHDWASAGRQRRVRYPAYGNSNGEGWILSLAGIPGFGLWIERKENQKERKGKNLILKVY